MFWPAAFLVFAADRRRLILGQGLHCRMAAKPLVTAHRLYLPGRFYAHIPRTRDGFIGAVS